MKLIFYVILLFVPTILSAQELNCKDFHTGKFFIEGEGYSGSYLKRTKKKQIEKVSIEGFRIVMKVEWIDDCTYKLIYLRGNKKYRQSEYSSKKEPDLIVRIIETSKNYYVIESRFSMEQNFRFRTKVNKLD